MLRISRIIGFVLLTFAVSMWAQDICQHVGGVLMTNINAIALPTAENGTNLGPVYGDLAGSVAATVQGQDSQGNFLIQHYWVTSSGETIKFKLATLYPVYVDNSGTKVAVPWGHYRSIITKGGTGKYATAKGYLDYFGIADFEKLTLVLRYDGKICY